MTYDEIMEKWGNVLCAFTSYYKYRFTYVGDSEDGCKIFAVYGGDSADIYRYEVSNGEVMQLQFICPDEITVLKSGVEVAYYSSY